MSVWIVGCCHRMSRCIRMNAGRLSNPRFSSPTCRRWRQARISHFEVVGLTGFSSTWSLPLLDSTFLECAIIQRHGPLPNRRRHPRVRQSCRMTDICVIGEWIFRLLFRFPSPAGPMTAATCRITGDLIRSSSSSEVRCSKAHALTLREAIGTSFKKAGKEDGDPLVLLNRWYVVLLSEVC